MPGAIATERPAAAAEQASHLASQGNFAYLGSYSANQPALPPAVPYNYPNDELEYAYGYPPHVSGQPNMSFMVPGSQPSYIYPYPSPAYPPETYEAFMYFAAVPESAQRPHGSVTPGQPGRRDM